MSSPQLNPKNPIKPSLNQLNPLGWVFDEKPGFLHNPGQFGNYWQQNWVQDNIYKNFNHLEKLQKLFFQCLPFLIKEMIKKYKLML